MEAKILGVVINRVDLQRSEYGYHYYRYYYYLRGGRKEEEKDSPSFKQKGHIS